jgi:hypothetical protein
MLAGRQPYAGVNYIPHSETMNLATDLDLVWTPQGYDLVASLPPFDLAVPGEEGDVREEAVLRLVEAPQVLQEGESVLLLGPHGCFLPSRCSYHHPTPRTPSLHFYKGTFFSESQKVIRGVKNILRNSFSIFNVDPDNLVDLLCGSGYSALNAGSGTNESVSETLLDQYHEVNIRNGGKVVHVVFKQLPRPEAEFMTYNFVEVSGHNLEREGQTSRTPSLLLPPQAVSERVKVIRRVNIAYFSSFLIFIVDPDNLVDPNVSFVF